MFGYVTVEREELKVKSFEVYNGYYCGLCKSIGRRYGQLPRTILSYDMVFLAMILDGLSAEKIDIEGEHCVLHHLAKRPVIRDNQWIDFGGDAMVLLAYLKLDDDWRDEGSAKALAMKTVLKRAFRRAHRCHRELAEMVEGELKRISELEGEESGNLDVLCDSFGEILGVLLAYKFRGQPEEKPLYHMGKSVGAWIYAIDALDDLDEDIAKDRYNPFRYRKNGTEGADDFLYFHLSNTGKAWDLLKIKKNRDIIENIIFMGMRRQTEKILDKFNGYEKGKEIDND